MSRHPRRRRAVTAGVVALGAAAALAVPLGGWEHVEREGAAQRLEPGTVHAAEEFTTRVDSAAVLPVRPGSSLDPEEGIAYLAVYARLENVTEQTALARSDLVLVDAEALGELGSADSVVLLADPGSYPQLQPGLPADLAYVWEIDADAVAPGDDLRVVVVDRTAAESQLGAGTAWVDPRVGAVVELTAGGS